MLIPFGQYLALHCVSAVNIFERNPVFSKLHPTSNLRACIFRSIIPNGHATKHSLKLPPLKNMMLSFNFTDVLVFLDSWHIVRSFYLYRGLRTWGLGISNLRLTLVVPPHPIDVPSTKLQNMGWQAKYDLLRCDIWPAKHGTDTRYFNLKLSGSDK